ncbi:type IV secretion system protein [Chitinimonas koreensis]|uniref:type IV secretion system protein n=1 Tax=Chitinimonas koreensis TaxID=356302 RepID=UPI001654B7BA|nr:type IV secretion system protein [Chitinimonas koreensis]QNM95526.1 type IV secretion system protein [Chitinimonas koreensis]
MAADLATLAWDTINAALTSMSIEGATMIARAIPIGFQFTGVLALWALFWNMVDWFAEGNGPSLAVSILNTVITVSLVVFFLTAYMTANGPKGIAVDGINQLAGHLTGTDTRGAANIALTALVRAMSSMDWMLDMSKLTGGDDGGLTLSAFNPFALQTLLTQMMVRILIIGAITLSILVCALIYLALYTLSDVFLILALIFGPLLMPWVLVERFSFLCDGWIRFSVGAALLKLVATVLIQLAAGMVEGAQAVAAKFSLEVSQQASAFGPAADLMAAAPCCSCSD